MRTLLLALALTGATAAQAQTQTWDYSDGNPWFNTVMVLSTPLPENGTVDVSPLSFTLTNTIVSGRTAPGQTQIAFGGGLIPWNPNNSSAGPVEQFQFTTVKGAITAFGVAVDLNTPATNTPTLVSLTMSNAGDSYFQQTSGAACQPAPGFASPCVPIIATGGAGAWADPPAAVKAPEIDPASAAGGLALLLGGLAVLRGRRPPSSWCS